MVLRKASFFLFLVLSIGAIYARGQIEERVAQARELIRQNNLNEAELLLVEIEREDPERQDEVEEMRSLIRAARKGYNQLYSQLIQTLKADNREDEAVEIIRQLEALDTNPNPATARLIFEAKRTVLFKQSLRRFNELMDSALAQINQKAFLQALSLYRSGFEIHREIFDEEDYDSVTKSSIIRLISQIENAISIITSPQSAFPNFQQTVQNASRNLNTPEPTWLAIRNSYLEILSIFQVTETALLALRQQDALLSRAQNLARSDPYLTFMNALISGRDLSARQEGILGATYLLFQTTLSQALEGLLNDSNQLLSQGLELIRTRNYPEALKIYEQIERLSDIGKGLDALWNRILFQDGNLRPNFQKEFVTYVTVQEKFRFMNLVARLGQDSSRRFTTLNPSIQTPPQDLTELTRVATQSRTFANETQNALASLQQYSNRLAALRASEFDIDLPLLANFLNSWQTQIVYFRTAEADFYHKRAEIVYPGLNQNVESAEQAFREGNRLFQGERKRDELGLEYVSKFPRQALEAFLQLQQNLDRNTQEIQVFLSDYQAIARLITNDNRITSWINQGQALLNRINALRTNLTNLIPQARQQVAEAESLLVRARESLVSVESNIAQQRFREARNALNTAQSLWEASFLIQDNPELKSNFERQRSSLATTILNGEREQVARDVRNLIQQGSQAYLQSRFIQAEEILLRARDRWADTETEPNVEVEQWLGLTRNALTFSSGRELNKTDPLYFEIQPLLNFAVQDYETARQLWLQNRQVEARALLEKASMRLEQVRIPFPLNQTAGVLQLKILQLTASPAEFNTAFENLFNRARNLIPTNPTQALADFQDLAAIQPNYPGLQQIIRQLRITVGLDPPPPNPANLARSRQLANQAATIVNANQFNRFSEARALVEEALRLDPNNTDAQTLLDRILITGPRTGVAAALTPQERSSLDQAAQLFNQGRFFEAKAIVDRLLATPKNRTNAEILKLQTSINARLRI
jgi:hypothetical protein